MSDRVASRRMMRTASRFTRHAAAGLGASAVTSHAGDASSATYSNALVLPGAAGSEPASDCSLDLRTGAADFHEIRCLDRAATKPPHGPCRATRRRPPGTVGARQ